MPGGVCKRLQLLADEIVERVLHPKAPLDRPCGAALLDPDLLETHGGSEYTGAATVGARVELGSGQNRGCFVCCGVLPTDQLLFDPDDLRPSPADRSLAIRSAPGRPLGKEERAFNRAIARLQALSRALDEEKHRLDRLLVFHAAEIRPRTDRAVTLRVGLVRALAPFLDDRRLTKAQHRSLRRILVEQLDDVLTHLVEQPDPDLQALFERLHDVSYAQAVQDDIEEAQAGMAAIFDELGLDVEVPELHADMTEEDAAAAAAQLAHELRRAGENHGAAKQTPRHQKTARAAEERARQQEQLRKDSVGAIYRRLARQLHPDLERDPVERERKSRVMQDITAAYTRGDLHALLQLEVAWLVPASGDAAGLSGDKLRAYTASLKEQAAEIEAETQSLRFHPRYAALIIEGPFGVPMVIDGLREMERLDGMIEQLDAARQRLSSNEAIQEVRGAIRRVPGLREAADHRWTAAPLKAHRPTTDSSVILASHLVRTTRRPGRAGHGELWRS